jgi:two-component system, response regulator
MELSEIEIVLIEDSIHDAEMTIRALNRNNVSTKILHLKDGAEALEFFFATGKFEGRNLQRKPKIILLDLKMPKVDGLEVLEKIKSHDITRSIPVIMLTSSREDCDIEKSYLLGANSYIVKPVDFDEFNKAITGLGLYWIFNNQPL